MLIEPDVAKEWYSRAAETQDKHYLAALMYSRRHFWLGIPVILLTAAIGTSVFASLQERPEPWAQIGVGLMSVAATVLASLQTFLAYGDRAEKHRAAGARYGAIGRQLELMLTSRCNWEDLAAVKKELDTLAQECPNIPSAIFNNIWYRPPKTLLPLSERRENVQEGQGAITERVGERGT